MSREMYRLLLFIFAGISALSAIVDISPSCAIQHQNIVIDCLDDKDATIRFKVRLK